MKPVIIGAVLGVLILGGIFAFSQHKSERTTREMALTCGPEMTDIYHIHPMLQIVVDGKNVEIPANIGIAPTCLTAIHTHTPDGIIHVESPEKRDFTLGDFFAVWKQPLSKDEVLTYKADATHRIRITVNGVEIGTYENTILRDREHVVIIYEAI